VRDRRPRVGVTWPAERVRTYGAQPGVHRRRAGSPTYPVTSECTGPGLTINAIEAGSKAQGEKIVHWTSALWKGTRKAVNWNAGPGMDAAELKSATRLACETRSCLIDGEAVACDENGLAVFERLRRKPSGNHLFLYAFDLLELNGTDLRRELLETRKA